MAVTLSPTDRYCNPASFRTMLPPDVTRFDGIETLAVRFRTDGGILQDLLPDFFELPTDPVVTVAHAHNIGVDWLAGRTYHVARVETQVICRRGRQAITGPFSLVIWESDAKPVIIGRELQGYQKIVGNVPAHRLAETGGSFECFEYDARLFRGALRDLQPVSDTALAAMQAAIGTPGNISLGWKYIPSPSGGADLDYVTLLPMRATLPQVCEGVGEVSFDRPGWAAAPGCAHIMAALNALPVLEYLPARMTRMVDVTLPRNEVRQIG